MPRNGKKSSFKNAVRKTVKQMRSGGSKAQRYFKKAPFNRYITTDPFPAKKPCKLHYSETFTFTSGVGGIFGTEQVMSLNSLFDPNTTGVGHQPYGHDELALLYKSYKVFGVLIKLTFTDPSDDGVACGARICSASSSQSMTSQSIAQVDEQPMSVVRYLNNTGNQKVVIKQYVPMYVLAGLTKLQFDATHNNSYTTSFGSSPAATPNLRISCADINGTSGTTCKCVVNLTYFTQCFERAPLSQS